MFATYNSSVQPEFDSRSGVFRTTHDTDCPWPASTTTVLALGSLTGVEPTDMLPLAGAVNPDTLNHHVQREASEAEISFEFHGYDVTVRGDGHIEFESIDGRESGPHDPDHFDKHGTGSPRG